MKASLRLILSGCTALLLAACGGPAPSAGIGSGGEPGAGAARKSDGLGACHHLDNLGEQIALTDEQILSMSSQELEAYSRQHPELDPYCDISLVGNYRGTLGENIEVHLKTLHGDVVTRGLQGVERVEPAITGTIRSTGSSSPIVQVRVSLYYDPASFDFPKPATAGALGSDCDRSKEIPSLCAVTFLGGLPSQLHGVDLADRPDGHDVSDRTARVVPVGAGVSAMRALFKPSFWSFELIGDTDQDSSPVFPIP